MDAIMKVKHSEGPGGVQNIELSFVNLFSEKEDDWLYMPGAHMRGTKPTLSYYQTQKKC